MAGGDRQDLIKELGDAIYYCARIAQYFEVAPPALGEISSRQEVDGRESGVADSARMLQFSAKVAETLKS
jgi:hypothetical protein